MHAFFSAKTLVTKFSLTLITASLFTISVGAGLAAAQVPVAESRLGQSSPNIAWLSSAEEAAEIASRTGRPILIYVRSSTCHYCDLLQKNVWGNSEASEFVTRNFVPLKLTKEQNPESVAAMKVKNYPTTLIFDSNRNYLGKVEGYLPLEPFLAEVVAKTRSGNKVAASTVSSAR